MQAAITLHVSSVEEVEKRMASNSRSGHGAGLTSSTRMGEAVKPASLIKLATWNMGGGILGASHQHGAIPSPDYYASVLRRHGPDVVCLQEAHDYHGRFESQPHCLARQAGYPHVLSFPTSASHLAEDASLTLAVLSRFPLGNGVYRQFPNPGLTGTGPDGEPWLLADKGYMITQVDLGGRQMGLINGHCFPLRYFGARATDPGFAEVWHMLTQDMLKLKEIGPAVVAVDLNHEPVEDVLNEALTRDRYINAFANTVTTVRGAKRDYILYEQGMRLLTATVTATESDHAYRQVSLVL
ncbi:endonuclease/exonuclease/phosphatase family protein [Micromonospora sp. ALFpr18c]|uniref:endonuclease/exonuclease/phosphatase family protein n=1 Tax=Micromonospora sp. ALFpr18c TaxID=1458665 RepID=UPI001CEC42F6|nr:endonuclease/exonuclease/phosphatase family protein [Micromonospora sp. ALFpr18c]